TFFNKTWLEFTGRTMEQEMGNGWTDGVHPDDFQSCLKTYVEAFDAREPFVMQYRLRRHDGEYRWISDSGVPRYDAQKNFAGYIGSCMDVTELINKEQALRESEERMSLAADAAGLIVWTWDIRRDEVTLSDKDRAFFGFSPREKLNGDRVRSVVHLEDRQFVRQLVENSLRTREELDGKLVDILVPERFASEHPAHRAEFLAAPTARAMGAGRELFGRRKDGSEFPVEIGLNPIQTSEGVLVLAAVVDIFARKLAE